MQGISQGLKTVILFRANAETTAEPSGRIIFFYTHPGARF